jgi:hypothetical protein
VLDEDGRVWSYSGHVQGWIPLVETRTER